MTNSPSSEYASVPFQNMMLLTQMISQWGLDRKITIHSTPLAQSQKTMEEVHELIEAAAACHHYKVAAGALREAFSRESFTDSPQPAHDKAFMAAAQAKEDILAHLAMAEMELADAIGDVYVTLVMIADCVGLDISRCIRKAYDEIRDRKGYLREDGVFVKEAPTTKPPSAESINRTIQGFSPCFVSVDEQFDAESISTEVNQTTHTTNAPPFPEPAAEDFISVPSPAKHSSPELHDHMRSKTSEKYDCGCTGSPGNRCPVHDGP